MNRGKGSTLSLLLPASVVDLRRQLTGYFTCLTCTLTTCLLAPNAARIDAEEHPCHGGAFVIYWRLGVTDFSLFALQVDAYTSVSYETQLCFWIEPGGCSQETSIEAGSGKGGTSIIFFHLDISLVSCLPVCKRLASLALERNAIPISHECERIRCMATSLCDRDGHETTSSIWITQCCRPNLHTVDGAVIDEGSESWTESYCEVELAQCMRQVVGGRGTHVLHLLVVNLILYL